VGVVWWVCLCSLVPAPPVVEVEPIIGKAKTSHVTLINNEPRLQIVVGLLTKFFLVLSFPPCSDGLLSPHMLDDCNVDSNAEDMGDFPLLSL